MAEKGVSTSQVSRDSPEVTLVHLSSRFTRTGGGCAYTNDAASRTDSGRQVVGGLLDGLLGGPLGGLQIACV